MTTKHTPGPWTCDTSGQPIIINPVGDTDPSIIAVLYDRACSPAHTNPIAQFDEETAAANARLIAAAPDLLAVAVEALRCMEAMQRTDAMPGDTCPADLYDMARTAMAKAGHS